MVAGAANAINTSKPVSIGQFKKAFFIERFLELRLNMLFLSESSVHSSSHAGNWWRRFCDEQKRSEIFAKKHAVFRLVRSQLVSFIVREEVGSADLIMGIVRSATPPSLATLSYLSSFSRSSSGTTVTLYPADKVTLAVIVAVVDPGIGQFDRRNHVV